MNCNYFGHINTFNTFGTGGFEGIEGIETMKMLCFVFPSWQKQRLRRQSTEAGESKMCSTKDG